MNVQSKFNVQFITLLYRIPVSMVYITVDNNSVQFKEFSSPNIDFINRLFTTEVEFKDWDHIKREFQLTDNNLYYKFTTYFTHNSKKRNKY